MTNPLREAAEKAGIVRKLEWHEFERGNSVYALAIVGQYSAWDFDGKDGHWRAPESFAGRRVSGDIEAAKAAAQADYEQRIHSALNPDFLSELDTARKEVERLRAYAETISKVVCEIAPLAGSESITKVGDAYYADPAFHAHRITEMRQTTHDGHVAKVKAHRAETTLTEAKARIAELEGALEKANRTVTDRLYMMTAYRHMLGPIGARVAAMWDAKGVKRQHTYWGPSAADLTGEERAQMLLDVENARKRQVLPEEIDIPGPTPPEPSHD